MSSAVLSRRISPTLHGTAKRKVVREDKYMTSKQNQPSKCLRPPAAASFYKRSQTHEAEVVSSARAATHVTGAHIPQHLMLPDWSICLHADFFRCRSNNLHAKGMRKLCKQQWRAVGGSLGDLCFRERAAVGYVSQPSVKRTHDQTGLCRLQTRRVNNIATFEEIQALVRENTHTLGRPRGAVATEQQAGRACGRCSARNSTCACRSV